MLNKDLMFNFMIYLFDKFWNKIMFLSFKYIGF